MSKVIITVGLPASGKSTWAKKYQEENERTVILNRDSLRTMLCGKWSAAYEETVKQIEREALQVCLNSPSIETIIIDDTNLNIKTLNALLKACTDREIPFEIKSFLNVGPMECIERDSHREHPVGETAIMRMWESAQKLREIIK